ncbi:MAG: sterol-binding protein [Candidatus Solincola sediminis]|uniref:Sterol-binding protein n=1 Tax=Candidatus Solincola sediminis TaxID=1797199 RepID=A0A1F2WM84_9ACTN|nr:MAG: sterol-binding protein [Candidatus Solincola sediminis]OFW61569.1 MAG: sterol-binding protein [Candidatus Solincola sediminis]
MANFLYLSPEWAEEGHKRAVAELTPEKLHHVTSSMTNIYKNCPDGKEHYFHVAFEDGKVKAFETGEGEGPKGEFKIIADYETFAKISRAELGAVRALTSRKLTLRGNMAKALRLAPLVDKLNKILAGIPTDF